jgi:hypothetical protein
MKAVLTDDSVLVYSSMEENNIYPSQPYIKGMLSIWAK